MSTISVNAVLLRGMLPDLRLTPGTTVMGRVVERHGDHGLLNLAGAVLVAKLPTDVQAGQRLRLAVTEVTAQAVAMQIVELPTGATEARTATQVLPQQGQPQQAAPPGHPPPGPPLTGPPVPLVLPGHVDARVRVGVDEQETGPAPGGAGGMRAVTVHYDSPHLGRVELRLALTGRGLVAGVQTPPGMPVELATAHAGELRTALTRAMGRPVEVHVAARRDRVDLRA